MNIEVNDTSRVNIRENKERQQDLQVIILSSR